jgi:ribosomal-protein-serine acetyltransferase
MIGMELVPGVQIRLLEKRHARKFFAFIEKGRVHFEEWIPFVSKTRSLEQTETKIVTFLEMFKNGTGYFWCLWDKKRIIGLILIKDINEETRSAEIGYMIDKDFEGQGLIRKSCELMIEYLFTDLGVSKISLCCDEHNHRSIKVAQHFRFELEGVLKQDIVINGKARNTMHWALFSNEE